MSLFLTRLRLNQNSRQVINELEYPYEMHRTLMKAFPSGTSRGQSDARYQFGVLFRAEVDEQRSVNVYVQSGEKPNWTFLDGLRDYLCPETGSSSYECRDIMQAWGKIKNGQILRFRLRANPTKRIAKRDDPMRGNRVEIFREADQIEWLIRKGQGNKKDVPGGFALLMKRVQNADGEFKLVPRVEICCEGKQTGRNRGAGKDHRTTHFAVLFDGLLRVTDASAFLATMINGVGSSKAFGFGLLSAAPVGINIG